MNLPQIEPMKLSRIAAPFDHADFLFELKHDGFRCFAYIAAGAIRVLRREASIKPELTRGFDSLLSSGQVHT